MGVRPPSDSTDRVIQTFIVYIYNHGINVYMVDRFLEYIFLYQVLAGLYVRFSMFIRTSRFVYLQSDLIVTHMPLSYIFVHIFVIVSGYSFYVNMLVTRLKSDMCLVFLLHN